MTTVANPCSPTHRKPVDLITDRAKRYRANACPPAGARRCVYCGRPNPRDIDHINGNEADGAPENLAYACRSCNVKKGHALRRAGMGRLTRQHNPGDSKGAANLAQWLKAVLSARGEASDMTVRQAVAMIRATPAARRSEFAEAIWDRRRARGTDKREEAPF
jgi:hypothetical protein